MRAFPAAALADVAGTLQRLFMRDNDLASIAAGALDAMTQLRRLELQNNALASLPDDLLRPLTQLEIVQLHGNPGFTGFAPVVEAIPAQSFERGQWGQRVDLEAVLGASPWGDNVIWTWPQIGSRVTLNDADTATPWFNAPTVDADTRFTFTATATGRGTSGAGASEGARTARVTVQGPASIADVSVTSRPVDGSESFKRGDHIEVTFTFSEPVQVTVGGGISIGLRIGTSFIDSDFHRQEHPSKLIFRHVVVAADIENSGIVIGNDPDTPFETGEDDITLTAASIRAVADGTNARVDFHVQQTPWEVDGGTEAPTGGICGHGYHPKVLAAILDAVPGGNTSCNDVTDADLAAIASLDLSSEAIDSLHKRDFEGLTGLTEINLADNALDRLPGDLFEHVATLTRLQLRGNDIAALPAGVFDGLTALTTLDLRENALTGLPAGVFDDLTDLRTLRLQDNALTSLPDKVFAPLTKLLNGGLLIQGNSGFEDFVPRVTVSVPAQKVRPGVRVDLEAIVEPNPWGSNLVWSWTRTDTGGETVTLEDADSRVGAFRGAGPRRGDAACLRGDGDGPGHRGGGQSQQGDGGGGGHGEGSLSAGAERCGGGGIGRHAHTHLQRGARHRAGQAPAGRCVHRQGRRRQGGGAVCDRGRRAGQFCPASAQQCSHGGPDGHGELCRARVRRGDRGHRRQRRAGLHLL